MTVRNYKPGLTFGTPNVLHVHWLEAVFWGRVASRLPFASQWNASHLISTARKVSASGGKIVWTVHNLAPHEGLPLGQHDASHRLNAEFRPISVGVWLVNSACGFMVVAVSPHLIEGGVYNNIDIVVAAIPLVLIFMIRSIRLAPSANLLASGHFRVIANATVVSGPLALLLAAIFLNIVPNTPI